MAISVMLAVSACTPGVSDADEAREPVGIRPMTGEGVTSAGPQGGGSDGRTASQAPTGAVCPPASAVEASVVSINPLGPQAVGFRADGFRATRITVLLEDSLTNGSMAKVQLVISATGTSGSVQGTGWGGPGAVNMSAVDGEFTAIGLLRTPQSPWLSHHVVEFVGGEVESATAQVLGVVDNADVPYQVYPGSDSDCL